MNKLEATTLIVEMQKRWPHKKLGPEFVDFFRASLEKIDYAAAQASIGRLFEKRAVFPAIADIRKECGLSVDAPSAPKAKEISPRAARIVQLLSDCSNPSLYSIDKNREVKGHTVEDRRKLFNDLAAQLWWEIGPCASVEDAGYFAVEVRTKLGFSHDGVTAAKQIRDNARKDGRKVTAWEWLDAAGYVHDGLENLPEPKMRAPLAHERVRTLLNGFLREHHIAPVSRQEHVDDRREHVHPDADEYERRYP
jgi:hypothetical protein